MREFFSSIFSSQSSNLQVDKASHRKPINDLLYEFQYVAESGLRRMEHYDKNYNYTRGE